MTPGKLTVATSPDFAPYEFYAIGEDGTPKLAGFDMDLAQYIADYLGLELEVVTVDFDVSSVSCRPNRLIWAWPDFPQTRSVWALWISPICTTWEDSP